MNTFLKIIVLFVLIVVISFATYWITFYVSTGSFNPVSSSSCGKDFDSGFKNAIETNNPKFCLTFNLNSINQTTDSYGQHYCGVPQVGEFNQGALLKKGDVDGCLQGGC